MKQKLFYLFIFNFFLSCDNSTESNIPEKNIFIHHTKPDIKSEQGVQLFDSATAYADIGDFETAQHLLLKCNNLEPNNGTILITLGASYFATGDSAKAMSYFISAIIADSLKPEAYASAGCLFEMQGKYKESIDILNLGFRRSNEKQFTHYSISLNLAVTYVSMDSCTQAKKYLEIAKNHGTDNLQFDGRIKQIENNMLEICK